MQRVRADGQRFVQHAGVWVAEMLVDLELRDDHTGTRPTHVDAKKRGVDPSTERSWSGDPYFHACLNRAHVT